MIAFRATGFDGELADRLARRPTSGISLYWLGQAGFVIDTPDCRIVIDPYLSNSLAEKYRDTAHSHERMAPAPITADQLGQVDLVLCTHHHTDHMDGETLQTLAERLPALSFVVPAASRQLAITRIGVGDDRLILVDAGETREIRGIGLHVFRAAHETLERDAQGQHRFVGYGLDIGGLKVFHSGDTIPFAGQVDEIRAFAPQLVLLPVNGRSPSLAAAGFAGNLTLAEAIGLAEDVGASAMIAHHYGMFAFNTIAAAEIDAAIAEAPITLCRARGQTVFHLDDG